MKGIFLVLLTSLAINASKGQVASFQRMLIPAGEYAINGASLIPSFCVDEALAPPISLDYFVNSSSNIFVRKTIGNTTITKPLSEVNKSWIRIFGNDKTINSIYIEPIHATDGASYQLVVKNTPGYLGGKGQSVTKNLPNSTLLSKYDAHLNLMADEELRTLTKQQVIWKILANTEDAEISEFIKNIQKIHDEYHSQLNSFADVEIRKMLKAKILDNTNWGYTVEEIQASLVESISIYREYDKVKSFFNSDLASIHDLPIDAATLCYLIDNRYIKKDINGKLSEESHELLSSLVKIQDKFYSFHLYCCESLVKNIMKVEKENGLIETGLPTTELKNFIDEYGKPFEIVREYRQNGISDNILAMPTRGVYEDGYIIKVSEKLYFFDGESKPQLLSAQKVEEIEQNYRRYASVHSQESNDIKFLSIGSRDDESNRLAVQIGDVEKIIVWSDLNSYDQILEGINDQIALFGDDANIVLSKDMFTRGKYGQLDKPDARDLYGSKVLNGKYVENRTWINYSEFLRELQKRYPTKRFYLGGDFYMDRAALSDLPKIRSGSDIAAYIAPKSLGISFDRIASMKNKFSSANIQVHELDDNFSNIPEQISQANILLLSGHKESSYEFFLKKLADEGLLIDKVVAVFSCNEMGTAALNSYLIRNGLAKKVIFFPGKIDVTAINAVFSELVNLTKNMSNSDGILLDELIDQAIDRAIKNTDYEDIVEEIIRFKEFINQTSFISTPLELKPKLNG